MNATVDWIASDRRSCSYQTIKKKYSSKNTWKAMGLPHLYLLLLAGTPAMNFATSLQSAEHGNGFPSKNSFCVCFLSCSQKYTCEFIFFALPYRFASVEIGRREAAPALTPDCFNKISS